MKHQRVKDSGEMLMGCCIYGRAKWEGARWNQDSQKWGYEGGSNSIEWWSGRGKRERERTNCELRKELGIEWKEGNAWIYKKVDMMKERERKWKRKTDG